MTATASPAPTAASPWRRVDRIGLLVTTGVGLALIAVSWFGAADATDVGTQVRWVNAAVVGVVVLGAGNALWLLTGRRAAGLLRRTVVDSDQLARRLSALSQRVDWREAGDSVRVAGRTMTRYHRADCPLVADKQVSSGSVTTHVKRGRRPCGVCMPDGVVPLRSNAGA